ncbi:long-chain-fatty-acid--CoA ligase [Catenulispora yoronensis]|uniref:Long-chain-fatty-acid--CoA ligase n=1 Tax=Catenulispora yoronensis TaxID=450799 RepID=A0ABP5GYG0_9ACTN
MAELLTARVGDHRTALTWAGQDGVVRRVSWDEHLRRSAARAAWLTERLPAAGEGPRHVGVLMENVAEFSFLLGAAGLGGFTLVGLNPTRGAVEVARDARHTDCALIVTETPFLAMVRDSGIPVVNVDLPDRWLPRPEPGARRPVAQNPAELPFMLILTSGTTSAPKAVICSQGKVASQGSTVAQHRGLTADDVLYCAMPLFHSNAVIAAWIPALASGATLALRRRFSASGFLADVRRFQATYANYVGKPLAYILATPEQPDDSDNTLRQVFGNEAAPADVERFAKRFDCAVTDGFGSTEGGISFYRLPSTPPGALGVPVGDVRIVNTETGAECAVGEVGEMVNFAGAGAFEGYYRHQEADAARLRDGRFWSGDLAYRDDQGNFHFAGRSGDWIRVGGENFASGPITRTVEEWEGAVSAAAYGVPDAASGDQVMVALEPSRPFDPDALAAHLESRAIPDLWWPRYIRIVASMPRTATNKIVVRDLVAEAWHTPDPVFLRSGRGRRFRVLTDVERMTLAREFDEHGRTPPGHR